MTEVQLSCLECLTPIFKCVFQKNWIHATVSTRHWLKTSSTSISNTLFDSVGKVTLHFSIDTADLCICPTYSASLQH